MKKFRLFAIAFALCGVIGFYSCKDDDGPTFVTEMDAPTGLTVTGVTFTDATFQWIGVDNALIYNIEAYSSAAGATPFSSNQTGTSVSFDDFTEGVTYSWRVRSMRSGVYSDWVTGPDFTTTMNLSAPTDLNVSPEFTRATFEWEAVDNAGFYLIEVYSDSEALVFSKEVTGTSVTSDNVLTAGDTYTWRVRSTRSIINSDWTNGDDFTTWREMAVSVDFGDGEEVWDAVTMRATWGDDDLITLEFLAEGDLPKLIGTIEPILVTEFPNEDCYFEYFSSDFENRQVIVEEETHGDWKDSAGTVTLTEADDDELLISGTISLTMLDYFDNVVNQNETPATKLLTVTFFNVPLE